MYSRSRSRKLHQFYNKAVFAVWVVGQKESPLRTSLCSYLSTSTVCCLQTPPWPGCLWLTLVKRTFVQETDQNLENCSKFVNPKLSTAPEVRVLGISDIHVHTSLKLNLAIVLIYSPLGCVSFITSAVPGLYSLQLVSLWLSWLHLETCDLRGTCGVDAKQKKTLIR